MRQRRLLPPCGRAARNGPEKARAAGVKLKSAAKVDPVDQAYFRERIRPLLDDPRIEFIGEIGDADKQDFLGNARALLFPIDWPEPFGLAMIEAMACGTPVVAFRRGSVPEVVGDGVSGRVVDDVAAAVAAVRDTGRLPRWPVRRRFERQFTVQRMAQEYLTLYRDDAAFHDRSRPSPLCPALDGHAS